MQCSTFDGACTPVDRLFGSMAVFSIPTSRLQTTVGQHVCGRRVRPVSSCPGPELATRLLQISWSRWPILCFAPAHRCFLPYLYIRMVGCPGLGGGGALDCSCSHSFRLSMRRMRITTTMGFLCCLCLLLTPSGYIADYKVSIMAVNLVVKVHCHTFRTELNKESGSQRLRK